MFSETNRAGLVVKPETVWGETPAGGAFTQLRYTGETLDRAKQTAKSQVIRPDRMTDELALLGFDIAGDISGELVYSDWDMFIAGALCNTWTVLNLGPLSLSVDATAKKITRAVGSWITDGLPTGVLIKTSGFTNPGNNGVFYVASVTALDIVLVDNVPTTLVTEVAAAGKTIHAEYVINGVLKPSFVAEKQFTDLGKYAYVNGLRVSDMELDVTAMNVMKLKFSFLGKDMVPGNATVSASIIPSSASKIMTASASVGQLMKNDIALSTGVKSIKLTCANNLRKQEVVGSQAVGGIGYGEFDLKGSNEVYFEDMTLFQDVISHSTIEQFFRTQDLDGNCYGWHIPGLVFTKGAPKVSSSNQDVMLPLDWEAKRDAASNRMICVSRVAIP